MMPPKIDVCIEGYNIEQTDFYIAHIIDKYNSLNELYHKSCEHIAFLEKDIKNNINDSLAEMERRIFDKLDSVEQRLSALENGEKIVREEIIEPTAEADFSAQSENEAECFEAELSKFHSELEELKSFFKK